MKAIKTLYLKFQSLRFFPQKLVICPCCRWSGRAFLERRRFKNYVCPGCGALPRHRWLYLELQKYFAQKTFPQNLRILHVSPEPSIEGFLREKTQDGYTSIDIEAGRAQKVADLTCLNFPSNFFDFIFASHVLEHIKDDLKAIQEVYRVLKKDGRALICVPVNPKVKKTYEFTPEEVLASPYRHEREYGQDFFKRLQGQRFKVRVIRSLSYPEEIRQKYCIGPGFGSRWDVAAFCRK